MSRIDELIQQMCPDGVEFRALGEVARYVRGLTYSKEDETRDSSGLRVFRANNISVGLPAELAARRKQYEYYQDKLLTFIPLRHSLHEV